MLLNTKVRRTGWIVCALIPLLIVVACGKKQGPATSEQATKEQAATETTAQATKTATSGDPIRDYKVAYLTDEKMEKFIESMKEEMNPFDVIFKGGQRSFSAMKDEVEKLNTFARKYGFKGYEDYVAVWGRITVGEMLIGAEEMNKGFKEMYEKTIASAEKSLKEPNLSPEMKTSYEEQIASSKKALEDLNKSQESSLSVDDLNLIKKYKPQIDEAAKKYKPKTGGND